jgi:transposase
VLLKEQRYGEPIWDAGRREHEGAGRPSIRQWAESPQALRRQLTHRNQIVRQRTRLKNIIQSILHAHLIPPCPAADLCGSKGRAWLGKPAGGRAPSSGICASSIGLAGIWRSSSATWRAQLLRTKTLRD